MKIEFNSVLGISRFYTCGMVRLTKIIETRHLIVNFLEADWKGHCPTADNCFLFNLKQGLSKKSILEEPSVSNNRDMNVLVYTVASL